MLNATYRLLQFRCDRMLKQTNFPLYATKKSADSAQPSIIVIESVKVKLHFKNVFSSRFANFFWKQKKKINRIMKRNEIPNEHETMGFQNDKTNLQTDLFHWTLISWTNNVIFAFGILI